MTTQPEALRLAEHLEKFRSFPDDQTAAAELRRLHGVNQELLEAFKALLFEAESLREAYSHDRQREGWDAVDEEPCFTKARAAIAKAEAA